MKKLPRAASERADAMEPELRRRIEEHAYALWEADGRPDGRAIDYWLQAEREIVTHSIVTQSIAGEEDPLAGIDQQARGRARPAKTPPRRMAKPAAEPSR